MILNKILKNKTKNEVKKEEIKNITKTSSNIINFYDYIEKKNIKGIYSKLLKNTFVLLLLILVVFNSSVFARPTGGFSNTPYEEHLGDYRIYSRIGNEKYIYYKGRIQTNYEYYYLDKDGKEMPSYCLNLGIDGAETKDEYYVNASERLEDPNLVALMQNGYPYKDVTELGVENVTEAKYATQFAIWAYLSNLDVTQITATNPSYQRVVNAINDIYSARLDTSSYTNNMIESIWALFIDDNIDENYYSCNLKLSYNDNIKDINLQIKGLDKYIITDLNNNQVQNLVGVKELKILVPKDTVYETKKVNIKIQYKTRQTAILFGVSKIPGMQNVSVNLEPFVLDEIENNLSIKYLPLYFDIVKLDKDDENIVIPNVKFHIYDMQDKFLGEYVTDKNGRIHFDIQKELKLKMGEKIKIKEVEVPDNYYIDKENDTQIVTIGPPLSNTVVFKNEKIKGKVKIIKTSSDFNNFNSFDKGALLKDAVFEIYDSNDNFIEEITTNEKGEAISKDLLKGKYYVKEKSSPKHYILDDKKYEFEIKEPKKIVTLNISNESEKKVELPKTGF